MVLIKMLRLTETLILFKCFSLSTFDFDFLIENIKGTFNAQIAVVSNKPPSKIPFLTISPLPRISPPLE